MAQDITEKETTRFHQRPRTLDIEQLEYSFKKMFIYGTISVAALTLGVTYAYLLIQKIKN